LAFGHSSADQQALRSHSALQTVADHSSINVDLSRSTLAGRGNAAFRRLDALDKWSRGNLFASNYPSAGDAQLPRSFPVSDKQRSEPGLRTQRSFLLR
jgi:hypothetical protein